jgi:transposase InsO family protein
VGLGGVLYQEINDVKKILYYHSELLSSSQRRYLPIELEALAIYKCITRMKSFLLGRRIIVYTDNCPLCHMMEKKVLNKTVERIALLLQEFNIEQIIHVQGRYNCLPDYLSRHPITYDDEQLDPEYGLGFRKDKSSSSIKIIGTLVTQSKSKPPATTTNVTSYSSSPQSLLNSPSSIITNLHHSYSVIEHFDITKLKEQQQRDNRIQKIINDLKQNPNLSFEFKDGILYKLLSNSNDKLKRKLVYIPSSMIKSLLNSYHDNPLIGGHFAVRRTLNKIKQRFWWPDMKQSVIDHIRSCIVCQAYNTSRQKRPGFLHPIPPPDGPNQLLGVDFCGPFPKTPQNNRYVLCLTDYFTKFVIAIALPTCSASTTAEAIFKDYICRYGVPKAIISDQGTSFKNQLMQSLSQLLGYHHILCTPYHPQSNGQVERFNATFVTQLAKLTNSESNNWDSYLYPVVFAYNTGTHSTTNFSPFELTFGRQANLPIDNPPTTFTFSKPNDYFHQLLRNLKYYHAAVKENILQQHQRSKIRYDYHRHNPEYALGTTVLTRIFTTRSKLDPKFSVDPKIIVNKAHPIYWVQDPNTKIISRVHINDLRPLLFNPTN